MYRLSSVIHRSRHSEAVARMIPTYATFKETVAIRSICVEYVSCQRETSISWSQRHAPMMRMITVVLTVDLIIYIFFGTFHLHSHCCLHFFRSRYRVQTLILYLLFILSYVLPYPRESRERDPRTTRKEQSCLACYVLFLSFLSFAYIFSLFSRYHVSKW